MSGMVYARSVRAPFLVLARVLAVSVLAALPAWGEDVSAAQRNVRAEALTLSLASGAARGQALRDIAAERRDLMRELIRTDPEAALRLALPERVARRLSPEISDLLEYRGEVEGELSVVSIDHDDPAQSRVEYALTTDFGEWVSLHFAKKPTRLLTGERVTARGLILDDDDGAAMALESGEEDVEVAFCCSGESSSSSSAPELPNTLGAQRTVALLVNFVDDTSQPWTVSHIDNLMFGAGGASDWFYEVSHNQTWLTGDTYGWLTIDLPTADNCSLFAFADHVYQAAADAGIDLSPYDRRVIFTPSRAGCGYAGLGSLGGWPSVSRLNGITKLKTIVHEIGHNFGLQHGHSFNCGLETLGEGCAHVEYGDTTSAMGGPDEGHYAAFSKQRLGWLVEADPNETISVTTTGTFTLEPYETLPGSQPKAIRIPAGVDPANGKPRWMYLTYRQPIGFDSFYASRSFAGYCRDDVTDGIYAHLGTDGESNSSYLLNMRTDSCYVDAFGSLDWYNPRLATGESYTVPDTGAIITVNSATSSGASVSIDMGGAPPCVTGDPLVDVAPVGDNWGGPGDVVEYSVTVTSTDSASCDAGAFSMSAGAPSGWSAMFADASLTLAPGATGSTTLNLTSANSAADGSYDVPVNATKGGDAGSDIATYVVSKSTGNQPPVAADDSAETSSGTPVVIGVLDNDYDPDGDSLSIIAVSNPGKGSVKLNPDGTITYTPDARAKGSDNFGYTVSDGGANASANVAIAFAKGGGGGGNGNGKGPNK